MSNSKDNRVRFTVMLDDETLNKIREFGYKEFGSTNVSKAIRELVKKYYAERTKKE